MTVPIGVSAPDLLDRMRVLEADLYRAEVELPFDPERLHPAHRRSADNLSHYLALRRVDIRDLQTDLARLGLSSLGRSEAHVLATVRQVRGVLETLVGEFSSDGPPPPVDFDEGDALLDATTELLLGPAPAGRATRIMVTMPSEAASDYGLVDALVRGGMDCARINSAHDGPQAWGAMVAHVRRAAAEAGRTCPIEVDLAGPKLRTGPLPAGPEVIKVRPRRDPLGHVAEPGRAWLCRAEAPMPAPLGMAAIPVPGFWLQALARGAVINLRDARGSRRALTVSEVLPGGVVVETDRTVYLAAGTELRIEGGEKDPERAAPVGSLPAVEQALVLRPGDTLVLTRDLAVPAGAHPPRIGCTLPEVFDAVRPGDRIWFDDGKIGGVIAAVRPGEADIEIRSAAAAGTKLRAEKGINLPDTELHLPAITAADAEALAFAAVHADLVALSFVQRAADVEDLHRRLDSLGGSEVGVVLKIETKKAFSRLPELLLAAMARERVGVMIARGDLAVECGFERLVEVQEEILWLCEAAHLPVVWATQVLDQLARTGQASRAEVTDAAMSERAECVMLNKGPYICEAITALDDILRRMGGHQHKKNPLLRRLQAWSPDPVEVRAPATSAF